MNKRITFAFVLVLGFMGAAQAYTLDEVIAALQKCSQKQAKELAEEASGFKKFLGRGVKVHGLDDSAIGKTVKKLHGYATSTFPANYPGFINPKLGVKGVAAKAPAKKVLAKP